MQNRFKSILKLCGIRNVNFHFLRHTYATICIEKGFDPKTLSELLGHADAAITLNRYCHPSMQIKKDYVSRQFFVYLQFIYAYFTSLLYYFLLMGEIDEKIIKNSISYYSTKSTKYYCFICKNMVL